MHKSTGVAKEPLPTTHNVEGWRSCTCRSEIENRVVFGNASENVAGRQVDEEYLKYIVNIKFSFGDVFIFNINCPKPLVSWLSPPVSAIPHPMA